MAESRGPDEAEAPRRRGLLGAGIDRVAGAVVPAVTRSVDADELLERIDIDAVLERVDLDALLDRIDVDRLMTRIDVDALVQRVDVDSLVQRVDVDALMQRIDVQALVGRAEVGDIISQSTGQVASNTLDLVRRQVVGLDLIASRFVNRVLRRDPASLPAGPATLVASDEPVLTPSDRGVSGQYAGSLSRLAAYVFDVFVITAVFGFLVAALSYLVSLVSSYTIEEQDSLVWLVAYAVWAFLYMWVGLAIAGRTLGMLLVGIKVVTRDGHPLPPRKAFVRVLALPLSFLCFGLGLVGIVVGRERRALHDVLAGSAVVTDWGDRPAELPAPLSRWIAEHQPATAG